MCGRNGLIGPLIDIYLYKPYPQTGTEPTAKLITYDGIIGGSFQFIIGSGVFQGVRTNTKKILLRKIAVIQICVKEKISIFLSNITKLEDIPDKIREL
ncbi:MAG: hypothetical protein QW358_04045 [Candidatus Hadarchaeum sp.]